ncbi:DUF4381 domain-containing protein [Thiocapsa roseopersicina]|uniref:DUF4381 domain-containing protein n=1 Tax=Thiocapsa roseopersicina TaxID=1058 RepID=A0A1H2ZNG5_THIRO|nr:DUF4381 domain-containing protein [Thiocapsa roseopersicina]SDX18528.1 protein of unknown function [Thiocapsa roseopersicina]
MDPILPPSPPIAMLRDIHDIPPIHWWPPAPGWWLLAIALTLLVIFVWRSRARISLRIPIPGITLGTWRWEAAAALRDLRRRAGKGQDAKQILGELSELLRRIAMARLGRPVCAGLTGTAWLDWLAAQDPNGFPWPERGRVLIDAPYAPADALRSRVGAKDLLSLIDAAFAWVEVRDAPQGRRHGLSQRAIQGLTRRLPWRRARGNARA